MGCCDSITLSVQLTFNPPRSFIIIISCCCWCFSALAQLEEGKPKPRTPMEEKQGLIPTMVLPSQGIHQDGLSWGFCGKPAKLLKREAIAGWGEGKACLLGQRSYAAGQPTWGPPVGGHCGLGSSCGRFMKSSDAGTSTEGC